ncbi:MAG: NUDIX domain-containing protein [Patescibacteria group bacterium]|nr:NUDIX domain-containing protein [Patescibacteria group bacterium]
MKFEFSGVLVRKNGKILLVREKHKAAKNLWSLPLGFVEKGESLKGAAEREAKEESGYDVRILRKVKSITVGAREFKSAHPFLRGKVRLTIFFGKVSRKRPRNAALIARWFRDQEIESLDLRGKWEKKFLPRKRRRSTQV